MDKSIIEKIVEIFEFWTNWVLEKCWKNKPDLATCMKLTSSFLPSFLPFFSLKLSSSHLQTHLQSASSILCTLLFVDSAHCGLRKPLFTQMKHCKLLENHFKMTLKLFYFYGAPTKAASWSCKSSWRRQQVSLSRKFFKPICGAEIRPELEV